MFILFVVRDLKVVITLLGKSYKYKNKGTGSISYHLGRDLFRDDEDIICMAPKKYAEKMIDGYKNTFDEKPSSKYKSPLERKDHPELDTI